MDAFLSVHKISSEMFYFGQAIFLVWNSVNDPIIGWLSDRAYLTKRCES